MMKKPGLEYIPENGEETSFDLIQARDGFDLKVDDGDRLGHILESDG